MAVTNTLKYGTLVLAGFATITAWYYDSPWDKRWQIHMSDYVEIAEGVREREMIATAISGTNQFWLQIATNRSQMIALDSVITNLIPYFVDHRQIGTWAANYPATNSPPHWTVDGLLTYAIGTNRFPPYPLHTQKGDLELRFLVLSNMVMTDSSAAWGSNQVYGVDNSGQLAYESYSTNYWLYYPGYKQLCASNEWFWTTYANMPAREPAAWSNNFSGSFSVDAHAEDTQISSGFFQYAPGLYWNLYIYIYDMWITESAYWDMYIPSYVLSWAHLKNAYGGAVASKTNANMFGYAREIPIEREDWYYYGKTMFEKVAVPENTATSWTSYVELSPLDGDSLIWSYSMSTSPTNQNVACTSDFLDGVDRNSYANPGAQNEPGEFSNTNVASSVSRYTSSVPMGVIHVWTVERCKPF